MPVVIDSSRFRFQLQRLLAALPKEVAGPVLYEEARQFVRKVVSFLPPKTFAQGRWAVARDIFRTMKAVDPKQFTEKSIIRILRSGDPSSIKSLIDRLPTTRGRGYLVHPFSPSIHTSARNKRGIVPRTTIPKIIAGTGSLALVGQFGHPGQYVRSIQGRVGFLKSGYVKAARKLNVALPSFVARQPQLGQGSIEVDLKSPAGLHITIINRAGRYPDHARFVRDALRSRANAMRTKTLRLLRGKAVNLGFTRTG